MIPDDLFDAVVDWPPVPQGTAGAVEETCPGLTEDGSISGEPAATYPARGRRLPGGGGVYLLTDAEDRLVLLASAADLRRAVLARLNPGEAGDGPETGEETSAATSMPTKSSSPGRRRVDLSRVVRRIRWREAHSPFELAFEYWRIARVVMPDSYAENLGFGPSWFLHIDPDAAVPRLRIGRVLQGPPGTDLGPFATQSDAARFVEILQDAFDLCRDEHILEQSPHGRACAYFEMGRCPAPCDGSVPMSVYRQAIAESLAFAAGRRESWRLQMEGRMRRASAELAFERAAVIRRRLQRAEAVDHPAFRLVRPMERFDYLVVQRGRGRTRVRPFFVRGGEIEPGPEVRLKEIDSAADGWLARMRQSSAVIPGGTPECLRRRSEQIWLVSHFLFRQKPAGLFLAADSLSSPAQLAGSVRSCFARPPGDGNSREEDASPDRDSGGG